MNDYIGDERRSPTTRRDRSSIYRISEIQRRTSKGLGDENLGHGESQGLENHQTGQTESRGTEGDKFSTETE